MTSRRHTVSGLASGSLWFAMAGHRAAWTRPPISTGLMRVAGRRLPFGLCLNVFSRQLIVGRNARWASIVTRARERRA